MSKQMEWWGRGSHKNFPTFDLCLSSFKSSNTLTKSYLQKCMDRLLRARNKDKHLEGGALGWYQREASSVSSFYGLRDWKDPTDQSCLVCFVTDSCFYATSPHKHLIPSPTNGSQIDSVTKRELEELLWWEGRSRHQRKCVRNGIKTDRAREETDMDSEKWHFIIRDSTTGPHSRTPRFFCSILGIKNVWY